MTPVRRRHNSESGFALLLVFLMASIIAISLYMELPRLAFQSERQREQLLMERGEQYKRAIGLFLRTTKNTRWPATVEELESFNNHRFLRRRYLDPMTGKDEWRIIHIQNGILIDSVNNKKPNATDEAHLANTGFISELAGVGANAGGTGAQAQNPGLRRRPSDGGPSVGPDGQPIPGASGSTGASSSAGSYPGVPPPPVYGSTGGTGATGQPPTGLPAGGISGLMGIPTTSQNGSNGGVGTFSGLSGGGLSSQPTVPGAPPGFGGSLPGGIPGANGAGGQPVGQPGMQLNAGAQAAAAGLLQNLLTQPRPGGLQGITQAQTGGGAMGSGMAGVASKFEGEAIMVYGTKTDFSEWEFIYDPMKFQVQNPNGNGATGIGTPAAQIGSTAGMSQAGTPIGTGPGGTQGSSGPGGFGASTMSANGSGGMGAGIGSPMGGASGANSFGSAGGMGGGNSLGGASPTGASSNGTTAAGGSGTAFGQAGLVDIRPGKK